MLYTGREDGEGFTAAVIYSYILPFGHGWLCGHVQQSCSYFLTQCGKGINTLLSGPSSCHRTSDSVAKCPPPWSLKIPVSVQFFLKGTFIIGGKNRFNNFTT